MASRSFSSAGVLLLAALGCRDDLTSPTQRADPPAPALMAAGALREQDRGTLAIATYFASDASGCGNTRVDVVGSQGTTKSGRGAPIPYAVAAVSLSGTDWCTGQDITAGGRISDGVLFRVTRSGATLHATIPADGRPGVKIRVDMAWTSGAAVYSSSMNHHPKLQSGGSTDTSEVLSSKVTSYAATVSGTVSMDGVAFVPDPFSGTWASIDRYRSTLSQGAPVLASQATGMDPALAGSRWGPWWRETGTFATARFRSIDRSGCVESFTTVRGTEYRTRQEVVAGPFVDLNGFEIDHCLGTSGLEFSSAAEADNFQVSRNHTGASLRARLPTYASGTETEASVNIAWTGGHLADHGILVERVPQPGCESTSIARGTVYDARASGTIVVNGQNLTPDPAVEAHFGEDQFSGRGDLNGCDD